MNELTGECDHCEKEVPIGEIIAFDDGLLHLCPPCARRETEQRKIENDPLYVKNDDVPNPEKALEIFNLMLNKPGLTEIQKAGIRIAIAKAQESINKRN